MKQVEYTFLTLLSFIMAYSMLAVSIGAEITNQMTILLIQLIGWLFIGLGFIGAYAVFKTALITFVNFNKETKERRR